MTMDNTIVYLQTDESCFFGKKVQETNWIFYVASWVKDRIMFAKTYTGCRIVLILLHKKQLLTAVH